MLSDRKMMGALLFFTILVVAGAAVDASVDENGRESAPGHTKPFHAERNLTATEPTVFQFMIEATEPTTGRLTVTQERRADDYLTGQGPLLMAAAILDDGNATRILNGQAYFGDAHTVQVHISDDEWHMGPRTFANDGSVWARENFRIDEGRSMLVIVTLGGSGSLQLAIDLPPAQVAGPLMRELATVWTFGDISDLGVNVEAGLLAPGVYHGGQTIPVAPGDVAFWFGGALADAGAAMTGGFTCESAGLACPPVSWFAAEAELDVATEGSVAASEPDWYALVRAPTYADQWFE